MHLISAINFKAQGCELYNSNTSKYTTSEYQTMLKNCIAQEDMLILSYKKQIAQGDTQGAEITREKLAKTINKQNKISQCLLRSLNYPTYGIKINETEKPNIEIIG